ncbi:RNA export factor gle2 [Coemansia aciculifera]|uniref:RNA export factor gle2 n=1 Tax=Coemansia aciculifera TaxID=417176 RepID=A0A9W8M6A5_9FUNG|nr:RNA export factor gle2 [Coemansia aciculifera]
MAPETATAGEPGVDVYKTFKSLEWIEGVVWDLTGLPDAFLGILLHCRGVFNDQENAVAHQAAALELLCITDPAVSLFDTNGPQVLKHAIEAARVNAKFAATLAGMCESYYFLRSLDVFELDESSINELVDLLCLGDHGESDAECTHADISSALDACLRQLEAKYPGINHYANCVMLEANVTQEFGTSYEHLHGLRSELPPDGDLYMATLSCIVACAQKNMACEQMIIEVRTLFAESSSEHWACAFSFICELQSSDQVDDNVYSTSGIELDGTSKPNSMIKSADPPNMPDGTKVASGGADKAGRMFDISTGQTTQIAQHDAPIRCIKFVEAENSSPIVATAGWDKMLKYWDLRQQAPVASVTLPERAYAMDCNHPLLVVATAERKILIFDMNNPTTPFETTESPLKWQTRTVSCFAKKDGYSIGSIEGRVGIQYVDAKLKDKCFSFKCHRDATNPMEALVYSVNSITHHPVYGTFATGSNDGSFMFWDKDARQKLKSHANVGGPILSTAFNGDGKLFAYAIGYDWAQGYKGNTSSIKNTIMLHAVTEEDVKPKQK